MEIAGAVLSHDQIEHQIQSGNIEIYKLVDGEKIEINPSQIKSAGIDLTLDSVYRRYRTEKINDYLYELFFYIFTCIFLMCIGIYIFIATNSYDYLIAFIICIISTGLFVIIPCQNNNVVLKDGINYKDYTELYDAKETKTGRILINPGETVLGITQENIKLSSKICGILNGRSSFARMGLCIHITALFINPGVDNQTVLEINNTSPYVIELIPGTPICQMIFLNMDGESLYDGKYNKQSL